MAKLVIFALLILTPIAMASTNSYNTVVTTTSEFDGEGNQFPTCDAELQSMMSLAHCRMYMMQRMGIPGSPVIPHQRPLLPNCCDELSSVSYQCTCEALRRVMMGLPRLPWMMGRREDSWQVAKNLPQTCRLYAPRC